MMGWNEIARVPKTKAGVSGTVTFNAGAAILQILSSGSGGPATIAMPNGDGGTATVPIAAYGYFEYQAFHAARIMSVPAGGLTIVFTATAWYFVEYLDPAGT